MEPRSYNWEKRFASNFVSVYVGTNTKAAKLVTERGLQIKY